MAWTRGFALFTWFLTKETTQIELRRDGYFHTSIVCRFTGGGYCRSGIDLFDCRSLNFRRERQPKSTRIGFDDANYVTGIDAIVPAMIAVLARETKKRLMPDDINRFFVYRYNFDFARSSSQARSTDTELRFVQVA